MAGNEGLQEWCKEAEVLLRSKAGALWVSTREELRACKALEQVAARLQCEVVYWSSVSGFAEYEESAGTRPIYQAEKDCIKARETYGEEPITELFAALAAIKADDRRALYIMIDCKWYAAEPAPEPRLIRATVELLQEVRRLPGTRAKAITFVDTMDVPSVSGFVPLALPLPTRAECEEIVKAVLDALPRSAEVRADYEKNGKAERCINALVGLEAESMSAAIRASVVAKGVLDADYLLMQKKQMIAASGFVQWIEPDLRGMANIGGNEVFISFLGDLFPRFSPQARAYGLEAPKGILVAGVPGTGKSATFRALLSAWKMPGLRVLPFESKFVGESQSNLMQVFRIARAVAPCVLLWDECEKTFAGAATDTSGVTLKTLGIVLTEIQEEKSGVFHFFTCNNPTAIAGELLRRMEGIFWCDLPNENECQAIVGVMCKRYPRAGKVDTAVLAREACKRELTGAEIEKSFQAGMARAFADGGRDTTTADVQAAMGEVVPVIRSYKDRIEQLRAWAAQGARQASRKAVAPKAGAPILGDSVLM